MVLAKDASHNRLNHHLLSVGLIAAGLVAVLVLMLLTVPRSSGFDTTLGSNELGIKEVSLALDADRVLLPGDCTTLRWQVNAVEAIFINEQGYPGQGELQVCAGPEDGRINPHITIRYPDGSERYYDMQVAVLSQQPAIWLLGGLGLGLMLAGVAVWVQWRWQLVTVLRFVLLLVIGLSIARFVLNIALALREAYIVWDDALMFVRYVYNAQTHGMLAWNVVDGPTYGLTELYYTLPVDLVSRFISFDLPSTIAQVASLMSGLVFVLLVCLLVWRTLQRDLTLRLAGLALLFGGLAAQPGLGVHFASGMGTTFALAYLTLFLILIQRYWRKASTPGLIILGLLGGLAYGVRPDLMLFSAAVPAALLITPGKWREGLMLGALMALVLGAQLLAAQIYFGSALPLPFYAKSTGIYDAYYENRYGPIPLEQLSQFILNNALYLGAFVLALALAPRQLWQRMEQLGIVMTTAGIAYAVYYAFFVLMVMFYMQRFYYPLLPLLVWLAMLGLDALWARVEAFKLRWPESRFAVGAVLVSASLAISFAGFGLFRGAATLPNGEPLLAQKNPNQLAWIYARVWYEIQHFAQIRPSLLIATSDIGLPGIANYDWTVIDLASLNQTEFIRSGFSAEALMAYQPDLVYLPGPHYAGLNAVLLADPDFVQAYEILHASKLQTYTDVALRRDSPHYAAMRAIVDTALGVDTPGDEGT